MKTFKDLEFKEHPHRPQFNTQAKMFFDNGYGISVITGSGAYKSETRPYEVAVIKGNEEDWSLCYDTPITDDVIGYNNEEDVTEIMKQVQKL
jgi:hypothetical protein